MRSAVEGPRARGGFRIQLLGSFTVQVDGNAAEAGHWRLRKARALVAMLALAPGQRCQREQILDRLWPDLEFAEASRNLHQTLYVARRTLAGLGVAGDCLMILRDGRVVLDGDGDVAVDVLEFERVAAAALASGVEAGLRDAAELYVGELLPEFPDAQWLMGRRVALGALNREVLVKLAATVRHDAP